MQRIIEGRTRTTLIPIVVYLLLAGIMVGCGGSSGNHATDVAKAFNKRDINLYSEVPLIRVEGNLITRNNPDYPSLPSHPPEEIYQEVRSFNAQTPLISEMYDADNDGIADTLINDIDSYCNATNRMLDIELAACVTLPPNKHEGYLEPLAWCDRWVETTSTSPQKTKFRYQYPDAFPPTAADPSINGTMFIQLILPFNVNRESFFDTNQPNADLVDYLNSDFITIEYGNGDHVSCTVLVDGVDVNGNGPEVYEIDPQWTQLSGINTKPGINASSIVFIAQPSPGITGNVPDMQEWDQWAGETEIRLALKRAYDLGGTLLNLDSKWSILKFDPLNPPTGATLEPIVVESCATLDPVKDAAGANVVDPDGYVLVNRATNFILRFNKPVIPETVGQSIVFGGAPFYGNMEPLPTTLGHTPPPPNNNPCTNGGMYHDPISSNVTMYVELINSSGTSLGTKAAVPFRVYPLHQNNLCTYILNPIVDLPGSSDLGTPPFSNPEFSLIRVSIEVCLHDANTLSGQATTNSAPVNMGVTGLWGVYGELCDTAYTRTFTVTSGGRYVNAPVSPHAMYYSMGPAGMGIVDLDGNGFTTNNPDFSKPVLVTAQAFYNRFGNSAQGIGNNYAFGYKATQGYPYIGLGAGTPMPGINEGSTGIDEVVRDSNGNAKLFPDPTGDATFYNITDMELGDFLDTIYFDGGNEWAHKSLHVSVINQLLAGSFPNNIITTPPTPNPPPLAMPIGMSPCHVTLDEYDLSDEGAFVIMGKEVFTTDCVTLYGPFPFSFTPKTGFVHLEWAAQAGSSTDESFPPNPSIWNAGVFVNYMNLGPVADSSTYGFAASYGCRQQIGNFLFVADQANNAVAVVNSNTMEVITKLTGLSQPDSLAVTTDLANLYVTNRGSKSVSVFNVDPRSENFLYPVTTIFVGDQPKGICVQPCMNDVFVCNFGSNTISIINPETHTVRKTVSSLLKKPWDMVAGARQTNTLGWGTDVYHGFISNHGGNNILIFESGPDGYGGVGYDDILDAVPSLGFNGQQFEMIQAPRGICYDPLAGTQYPLTGGCFVAHRSGSYAMVSQIEFLSQQAPWGPIFLVTPSGMIGGTPGFGKRVFNIMAQWGGPDNPLSGTAATDVALPDYNREAWLNENWFGNVYVTNIGDVGASPLAFLPMNNKHPVRFFPPVSYAPVWSPDLLYVSFEFSPTIDILETSTSTITKTITGLPAPAKVLKTYFKM